MSRVLNTEQLIASARTRTMSPESTNSLDDPKVINILNEEIDSGLLHTLLTLNEENLVIKQDFQKSAGQNRFKIPYRAVGNKLREVSIVTSDNKEHNLARVGIEDLPEFQGFLSDRIGTFYVEGDEIVLVNSNLDTFDKIRMYYHLRPNTLVPSKETGKIVGIDKATGTIIIDKFPDKFSTNTLFDFVGHRSPNKILRFDIAPTSKNANTFSLVFNPEDLPKDLLIGDFLCLAEQTPVPNVPTEMHPLLCQRAAVHILESLGDSANMNNAMVRLKQMEISVQSILNNRVEGSPQKIRGRFNTLNESISRRNRIRR
jgi:hypothetical protein